MHRLATDHSERLKTRSSAIAVIVDRTACSILTLLIVIATSRLLNKKNPFAVSPRIQQLLRICVRNPQSAQFHLTCGRAVNGVSLLTNEPCLFDSQPESHGHLWRFSLRFCGAFCG